MDEHEAGHQSVSDDAKSSPSPAVTSETQTGEARAESDVKAGDSPVDAPRSTTTLGQPATAQFSEDDSEPLQPPEQRMEVIKYYPAVSGCRYATCHLRRSCLMRCQERGRV